MDSNEEYLDQLLKSLTEGTSSETAEGMDDSEQDNGLEDLLNQFSDDMDSVPQELLSGLLGGTENMPDEQSGGNQRDEQEEVILSDMIQDMAVQDSGEQVELLQSEQDISEPPVFGMPEQEMPEISVQSDMDISEPSVSEPEEEPESDMAWETEFDMFKDPESDMSEQTETVMSESAEPEIPAQTEPDISEQADILEQSEPNILEQSELDIPEYTEADILKQTEVDIAEQSVSDMSQPEDSGQEEEDLGSLLEGLGEEGQEISDLLDKAERDEPIDDMVDSLMQELNEELSSDTRYAEEDYSNEMAELLERPGKKKKKKERIKKEKVKKEKVKKEKKPRGKKKREVQESVGNPSEESPESNEEGIIEGAEDGVMITTHQEAEEIISAEAAEKKRGFWSKLLDALIQEDEEEEEPADLISDENGEILKELDKEKKQAKGKKKKGKDKNKKAADPEDDEETEEAAASKGKKKKEKKPKKEKAPAPVEDLLPGKKLPLKKVMSIMLTVLVFGVAYILVSHLYIDYVNKQGAERAYYAEDYMECYSLLFGQDRNENQELMYRRSELALQMERMKGNYRRLVMEGKDLEALDYLVQCVYRKESVYLQGQEWNCMDMVEETYTGMIGLMTANYGLSEERAVEIATLKSDVDYTLALIDVLKALESDSETEEGSEQQEPLISYEDLLPEEEENSDATEFVDTME